MPLPTSCSADRPRGRLSDRLAPAVGARSGTSYRSPLASLLCHLIHWPTFNFRNFWRRQISRVGLVPAGTQRDVVQVIADLRIDNGIIKRSTWQAARDRQCRRIVRVASRTVA